MSEPRLWNALLSTLVRKNRPEAWGNWALSGFIEPGAVGIVDPTSGDFSRRDQAGLAAELLTIPQDQVWKASTEKVSEKQSAINFGGTATNPETGTAITAGLEISWGMSQACSVVSNFCLVSETMIADPGLVLEREFDRLATIAKRNGMGTDDGGIAQGFGVITSVLYANNVILLGNYEKDTSFSLMGSVDGTKKMVGEMSGSGSYVKTSSTKSLDTHLWPAKADEVSPYPVPVAYTFASFDGRLVMPRWINRLNSFQIFFSNSGSYIAHAELTFIRQGLAEEHRRTKTISGGKKSEVISDIPLDAINLRLRVTYEASKAAHPFAWDRPLGTWLDGERHIEISGMWANSPKCREREATLSH